MKAYALSAAMICFLACDESGKKDSRAQDPAHPASSLSGAARAGGSATVSMKAGFDSRYFMSGGKAYLYLELKGVKDASEAERIPLNLSLVLDRSGSMRDGDKLENLKRACETLIQNLKPEDYVSVVAYATDAEVIQKSSRLEHKEIIRQKIRMLTPTSATNLSGGMLMGFQEAKSTKREKYVNRVLLLSDGLANQGVTEVTKLQEMVRTRFKEDGVAISTFGLGEDYNEDLMTNIAEAGKGNYYFIANPEMISGIFGKELNGLLSVVAQNVRVKAILPANGVKLENVYGYEYETKGDTLLVDFNDVFSEETKAVLIELAVHGRESLLDFKVELEYDDVAGSFLKKNERLSIAMENTGDSLKHEEHKDAEVQRNIVLFKSIDNFEKALKFVDEGKYDLAKSTLGSNKKYMDERFAKIKPDSALVKQYELNGNYEKELADIGTKSAREFKMLQKSSKSAKYGLKKKR
jgi:Ca-activated chloride channel homolog